MSPDSDVIGINYDGTTAGKKRQSFRNRLSPRNSLDRACWQALPGQALRCRPLCGLAGPGRDHRAGGREPLHGPCHRGVRPRGLFCRRPPAGRSAGFRGLARQARSGASATRAIAPPLSPIPIFTAPGSAATTRSIWPAASPYAGNPRFWLISGQRLYLFGREENRDAFAADPARFLREANALWPVLEQDLRSIAAVARRRRGSPQAMNSGTMKPLSIAPAPLPNCRSAPWASVILPPAAVTTAWPAATSHSRCRREAGIDVGAALRHPAEFDRRTQHLRGSRRASPR